MRFEASQNRQCTIFPEQPVVQKQLADRRVEVIRDGMTVKIDYENSPTRDATHLMEDRYDFALDEVVREERANDVIERVVGEWQKPRVTANRTYLRKIC